jgi:putative glutamine amidotransferase
MGSKSVLRIGIPTNLRDKRFGTHGNYIEWVAQFGQPVLLTPHVDQFDQFDVLFLTGGKDVSSNLTYLNGASDPHLEWFDKTYIQRSFDAGKPIFGVCRGMQTLNIHFGGTVRNLYGAALEESNVCDNEKEKNTCHESIITILNEELLVNSIHHQVVHTLAKGFTVVAKSKYHNHPEAIIHKDNKVAAVQWHPEKINDKSSKELFNRILR